eukprot:CAMPEP_0204171534 /NCGR_PEP_ID=MMETSP0361-20130328/43329_1 /ASSEMBLY_ACC=CAM_ASM_000343 /TAXON_ID=268821 /ORGANISM="Scrippsiella Hangoei, Strain SHTV-5" /LENGTH=31 /DNA_ID= /DNA_START= /DNA_END= /DNA_ORIENTATION=
MPKPCRVLPKSLVKDSLVGPLLAASDSSDRV